MGGEYDHWMDQTGVRYQYPNAYRNRVHEGRPFIYYRGVRRTEGRRGQAEYFGAGRIGTVSRDESVPESAPRARWKWFCEIEDYVPFDESVPARRGGRYFEQISGSMGWRTGVREISEEVYRRILEVADLSVLTQEHPLPSLPDVRTVTVTLVDSVASTVLRRTRHSKTSQVSVPGSRGRRHSARTKAIGDRAEEIVYRWLRRHLAEDERESVIGLLGGVNFLVGILSMWTRREDALPWRSRVQPLGSSQPSRSRRTSGRLPRRSGRTTGCTWSRLARASLLECFRFGIRLPVPVVAT